MSKWFKQLFSWIAIVSFIGFGILCYTNDYMSKKETKCLLLDKVETAGGHKRSGRMYLILQSPNGTKFDINASPTAYSQTQIGKYYVFELREFDIKQTPIKNLIYFFGPIVTLAISMGFFVASVIQYKQIDFY